MNNSALTAVAEAAAGEPAVSVAAPAAAAAPAPALAAAPAAAPVAATEPVATISAADALDLLATGYPDMATAITPLATLARAGCDVAAFGKAVLTQVATDRAADPALSAAIGHRPLRTAAPDNSLPEPAAAAKADVPAPDAIYSGRATVMATPEARPH